MHDTEVTRFAGLDIMVILAAQHLQEAFSDDCECECPRCCLACRAVRELITSNQLPIMKTFDKFGIEGHPWQDKNGFDLDAIYEHWHDPCPAYAMMEAKEGDHGTQANEDDQQGGRDDAGDRDPGEDP